MEELEIINTKLNLINKINLILSYDRLERIEKEKLRNKMTELIQKI